MTENNKMIEMAMIAQSNIESVFQMAEASTEIPTSPRKRGFLEAGTHAAYYFDSNAEKQSRIFPLCREIMDAKNAFLIYIAGKQGVKGIRLSLKDVGFDVAQYEKSKQLKIADSEEWFLSSGRVQKFKELEDLERQLETNAREAIESGFSHVTVISETDMLVRKGFLSSYKEFDRFLNSTIEQIRAAFVCAFDKRELVAAGVRDISADISRLHSQVI
ncbi:MAG: MEDS domain-containing protein [Thaumarchaeota archaeon]|nr:MEDS domain-containing protein [Nitrososphaerota archaeon]